MTAQSIADETRRLAALTGHRKGPYLSFNPVSATQIWQWCSAMGDRNPCYEPGDRQLAPPAMMQMWTMRDINDSCAPGSTDARQYQVFDDMKAMGYPANVAVSYDIEFYRYLAPGERVRHFSTVVSISERKVTGLGAGFFVTELVEYMTADDAVFAEAGITYFQYLPPAGDPAGAGSAAEPAVGEQADSQPEPPRWQPDFHNQNPAALEVGQPLPELAIPITHKQIVGGAIASQDFIPVHHNVPEARAAGMPDIFMNILTTCGLCARYLTDWAGRDSRLLRLQFALMAPNYPGDTMVLEGELVELRSGENEAAEVDIRFGGRNSLGYHTRGSATLALPLDPIQRSSAS